MQPFASLRLFHPLKRLLASQPDLLADIAERYGLTFMADDFDAKMSGEQMERMFDELALNGFPWASFECAFETENGTFGVFDYYLHACDTLGQALSEFYRYHDIVFQDLPAIEIKLTDDGLAISLHERYADGRLIHKHRANLLWGVMHNMVRQLTGLPDLIPLHVDSNGPLHSQAVEDLVAKWFGRRYSFNRPVPRLIYPAELWNLRLRNANPRLKAILLPEVKVEFARCTQNRSQQQLIADGINRVGLAKATLQNVCEVLDVAESSLKRKLKLEQLTFTDILNATRQQHAIHRLCESDDKIEVIAFDCGFGERTSFERAFKQWYGMSPVQFRADSLGSLSARAAIKRRLDRLPPLSSLAITQLRAASDSEIGLSQVAQIAAEDPFLVATLLAQANLPTRGAGQVFSVQEAMQKHLDLSAVKQTMLGVLAVNTLTITPDKAAVLPFWVRSFALIEMINLLRPLLSQWQNIDIDKINTIATLHNIGPLFVACFSQQEENRITATFNENDTLQKLLDEERQQWGYSRYQLGFFILTQWGLPPTITMHIKAFDPDEIESSPDKEIQGVLNCLNAFIEYWYAGDVHPNVLESWQKELMTLTGLSKDDVQQLAILTLGKFLQLELRALTLLDSN